MKTKYSFLVCILIILEINICGQSVSLLLNNVPYQNVGASGSDTYVYYKITLPDASTNLLINTSGGTGNCNLYVKRGGLPTKTSYDYCSVSSVNSENVFVSNPLSGDWYVMLNPGQWLPFIYSYSGVTLIGSYTTHPCSNITVINGCGSGYQQTLAEWGYGVWNTQNSCGYTAMGMEHIYQFTAPFTGTYSIQVTEASEWIDYFWKSSSCSQTGWNCIHDVNTAGTYGSMSWIAGTTYYILLDKENQGTLGTHKFYINCPTPPPSPCSSITQINGCGAGYEQTYFTGGGQGAWNTINCNYATPGIEKIYQFTAPVTGTYSIHVTDANGWVDYFWRSSGCSQSGWNCIQDIANAGTFGSMSWTAGTTYYILLDNESTSARTHRFYINCPAENVTLLTVDAPATNAAISIAGENDWYKFQTGAAGTYTIQTYGSLDTYMYLYQSDKTTLIAENDDGAGTGYNSKIAQSLSANTWYYVRIRAYSSTVTGNYSIDVKQSVSEIILIVDAPATNAAISIAGENDWYKFQTGAAGTYTIQTYGSLDTYMYLYQSDKTTLIAENDDGAGAGYNSKITQSLSANTWYFVRIKAYSSTVTGSYSVDVKQSVSEIILIVDAPVTNAAISIAGENDWYKFQTGAAGTYTIQTYGSLDTYMYLYQSDKTTLVAENDDGAGTGYNSKIAQSLSANTWYYVRIRAYSATITGSYSVDVKAGSTSVVTLILDAPATNAAISTAGENDWYKFQTGPEGSYMLTYTIRTYGSLDTYMYLYDSDQITILTQDDDSGEGNNAEISRLLNELTWYYVKVKAYSSTATGSYSIAALNWWNTKSAGDIAQNHKDTQANGGSATLNIFPNPASDKISVILEGDKSTLIRLEIVNQLGQPFLIKSLKTDQKIKEIIDIKDFPSGLYFIRIVTSDQILTCRFIKK